MKFKKLTIKNIGSIAEKTIDFAGAPLSDASLFLISGPTGSGKSIILDGICLALFGNAVRLSKISNRDNYSDPEFNCSTDGTISLSDPRQLVRRGTTDAKAELVFDGNNGKEYTASWSVSRGSKANINVRLSSPNRRVLATDGSIDCTKETECKDLIASNDIVGLKFEDFCRTTLLAQNDFTKFLDSKAEDKANILEKVTGTSKFSRIGERINAKYKDINAQAEALLRDINDPQKAPMTEEDRNAIEMEQREKNKEKAVFVNEKKIKSDKKTLLDRMTRNTQQEKDADELIRKAEEEKKTEAYATAVKTSKDWKASIDVRVSIATRAENQATMEKAAGKVPIFKENYAKLTGNLEWLRDTLKEFNGIEKQIVDKKSEIKTAEAERDALNPAALEEEGKRLSAEKSVLERILNYARQRLSDRSFVIRQDMLEGFSKDQKQLYNDSLTHSNTLWQAEDEIKSAEDKYKKVFNGFQDHAKAVRATLTEGDTCPVCGNVVKSILSDAEIEEILSPLREEVDKAKTARDSAKTVCNESIITISSQVTAKEEQMAEWRERNGKVTAAAERITTLTTELSALNAKLTSKTAIQGTIARIELVKEETGKIIGVHDLSSVDKFENKSLETQWNALRDDVMSNDRDIKNADSKCREADDKIKQFLRDHSDFTTEYLSSLARLDINAINRMDDDIKRVDTAEENAKAVKESCKTEAEAINEDISRNGFTFTEDETSEVLQSEIAGLENEISAIDTRSGEIKKTLQSDDEKKKNIRQVKENFEKIRPTLTSYETLNSLFGQNGGALFKRIAQSHLLGVLLENANFYLSQFTNRYELMRQEGSLVVLMKDKQQDDTPRPSNTLSGGESFMASLALALGLSSFNSSDFSSDTIFIDEGFGTLSPNCLTSVYETLASLKKVVGKKVGIISHVEELKEQIHPQIIVEPLGNGLSSINDPA